ncbi:hypothetical protein Gotri_026577 [Gossypium trilobum]|uniref:NAB domain-containing protein n=1 Tax=Gossypium trilobum TaxID=34281 RepID=A0A7J9FKH6_9ROSI|nr:hypothetical protein [Gossypium trilobum]
MMKWFFIPMSELDHKTKAMLKLIEEDADSFAQRAEMYYKKRPELICLVEDLYRAHRSLAERYDQVKTDPGTLLLTTSVSPFSSMKTINVMDKTYDSYSESFGSYAASEVDDPEHETEGEAAKGDGTLLDEQVMDEVSNEVSEDELTKLREEIERLKEENEIQKAQLMQKDEEKMEVIRQLSLAVQVLKDENVDLKKCIVKQTTTKKWSPFEFSMRVLLLSTEAKETAVDAGKDPDGEGAKPGPGANILSGLGGLGLEGIVGNDDSVGEGAIPLGVGSKGSISGGKLGEEDRGEVGKNAGAADILEN